MCRDTKERFGVEVIDAPSLATPADETWPTDPKAPEPADKVTAAAMGMRQGTDNTIRADPTDTEAVEAFRAEMHAMVDAGIDGVYPTVVVSVKPGPDGTYSFGISGSMSEKTLGSILGMRALDRIERQLELDNRDVLEVN